MAKISSYPSDANVTTSDRLIGSDNENSNETKNFGVGDIINLASSIILPQVSGSYVPYTGATGNVDLGNNSLDADVINAGDVYANNLFNSGGNPNIFVGNDSNVPVGLLIDTSNKIFKLGDYNGHFNGISISIENFLSRITFVGGFNLSNGQGTAGQVLTSQGTSATPIWTSLPSLAGFVPYTGATGGVNLGIYSLTAANVNANNFVPIVGGSGNTFFGGTGGYNNTQNGVYALGTNTTILGDSSSGGNGTKIEITDSNRLILIGKNTESNIEIDGNLGYISFYNAVVDFSNSYGIELSNGQGSTGDILTSAGAGNVPSWNTIDSIIEMPFLSAYSDTTQNIVAANVGQAMVIHQTVQGNAISVDPNGSGQFTRITPNKSGMYNIQFSAQLRRTAGGSSQTVDIWLRKGGVNVPYSNTSVNVQANAGFLVAAWNFYEYIDVSLPNPYIEIMWASTDNTITMEAAAANAIHPATPSLIVTVNKVSN